VSAGQAAAVLDTLLDLVLPQECAGCGCPATRWCGGCAALLADCARRPLGATAPVPPPPGFPPATAAASYDGVVRAALLAHKEHGRLALTAPLGRALAAAVAALDLVPGPLLLVPVPSAPREVRRRGHDHARRLAAAAATSLRSAGLDARPVPVLAHRRRVADQAGLDTAGRQANLRGALRVRRPVEGLAVVVVDDVVTTGATVTEAARALSAAGAQVRGAATVAASVRRSARTT